MALLDRIYWNGNGKHQRYLTELYALIPQSGAVTDPAKNKALEKFRVASNVYYDFYNNGLCNRAKQFRGAFGFACGNYRYATRYGADYHDSICAPMELAMDLIILKAAEEQGLLKGGVVEEEQVIAA